MAAISETLLDKLNDQDRDLVDRGVLIAYEGKDYPVLKWGVGPRTGQLAPGTGVAPATPSAENGRRGSMRQTNEYKELIKRYLPADIESGARGSLGWILDQALTAMEGGMVIREFTCSECGEGNSVEVWRKPDVNAIKLITETLVGRAAEQKDININSEQIYRLIDERSEVKDLTVFTVDPSERDARNEAAKAWIEGELV